MKRAPESGSMKRDTLYVYGGYILRYLSLLVLIPFYSRVLGPVGYGEILAAMALMNIVWLCVNYGLSTKGVRELASTSEAGWDAIFSRQLTARFMLTLVGLIIGIGGTLTSPVLAKNPWLGMTAALLGIANAFNLGWFFQGIRQFRISIAIEGVSYVLSVTLVVATVSISHTLLVAMASLLCSSLICTYLAYWQAAKYCSVIRVPISDGFKEMTGAGLLFLQSVGSVLMTSGATYFLGLVSTTEQVGYFGAAERFATVGIGFLNPLA